MDSSNNGLSSDRGQSSQIDSEPRGKVLLAARDPQLREELSRLLEAKYQVAAVPDGRAALTSALENSPHLVLVDAALRGTNGLSLSNELHSNPQTRGIPLILLCREHSEEFGGEDAEADDFLVQPFAGREVLARVEAQLELARARKQAVLAQDLMRQLESERAQLASSFEREKEARQTAELLNQLGPLRLAERMHSD